MMRKLGFLAMLALLVISFGLLLANCGDDDDDNDNDNDNDTGDDDTSDDDTGDDDTGDDDTGDDDTGDDDTGDDDTGDDDTGDDDTGDDDDDDTTDEFYVLLFVKDYLFGTALQGAACEMINPDGTAFSPAQSTTSNEDGVCWFSGVTPGGFYSVKITLNGYKTAYAINMPAPTSTDDTGSYWGFNIRMITPAVENQIAGILGLTPDATKGQVIGTIYWVRTVPTSVDGWADFVGCATVAPTLGNFYYVDASGMPNPAQTSTDPGQGAFLGANVDAGTYNLTITAGGQNLNAEAITVFANAYTHAFPSYLEADFSTNPTPADCN